MKYSLLFSTLLFIALGVSAAPIGKNEARQKAAAFLRSVNAQATLSSTMAHKAPRKGATTNDNEVYYYVFNAERGHGFVIVSGDDRTETVLGYSDKGSFDAQNMPENLRAWLQGYERQIQWLDDNNIVANAATRQAATMHKAKVATRNPVAPLITSIWDQTEPYNGLCPVLTNHENYGESTTFTGCVATAMAQVMYYNRWPQAQTKTVPAYTMEYIYYANNSSTKKTMQMSSLPSTTFEWANMIDDYSGTYYTAEGEAVAKLMQYCGYSVEMQYGTSIVGGSGTQTSKVAAALVNYFGYDPATVNYATRNAYTYHEWNTLIYNELANGRAVVYSGQSDGGGHAFVCDGYSFDDYFHINWGWSGSANGYFLLSVLNPYESGSGGSSTSNGFSYGQGAVIGIQPGSAPADNGSYNPTLNKLAISDALSFTESGTGSEKQWSIRLQLSNNTGSTINFNYIGFNVYDSNGNYLYNISWNLGNHSLDSGRILTIVPPLSAKHITSEGTYILRPAFGTSNTGKLIDAGGAETFYLTATVGSTYITQITTHPLISSLSIDNTQYKGDKVIGNNQTIVYTIRNNSITEDYNGMIYLFANNKNNKLATNGVAIPAGKSMDIEMNFTADNLAAGMYNMILSTDDNCGNRLHTQSVTLATTGDYSTTLSQLQVTEANGTRTGSSLYTFTTYGDDFIDATVSMKNSENKPFQGQITLMVQQITNNGTKYIGQYHKGGVLAPANTTSTVKITINGLAMGYTYIITPYYYTSTSGWSDPMTTSTHVLGNGVVCWTSDGTRTGALVTTTFTVPENVVAVDLCGKSLSQVTPNSNPNTLYYINEGQSIPNGLSGKNIIQGSTATAINLYADYGFHAPRDFKATAISYTRTFSKGHGNISDVSDADKRSGWETIVLPFAPTSVKNGTEELNFFTSDEDESGKYWLYEYGEDDLTSNTVYFTYPEKFYANRPFIIAVPGDKWGDRWNLTGKAIVFSAENAQVYADARPITSIGVDYFKFMGNYSTLPYTNIYALNTVGNLFALNANTTVAPFGAYFMIGRLDMAVAPGSINFAVRGSNGTATAISDIQITDNKAKGNNQWYSLDGRRLNGKPQQSGLYIHNGKKIIIN